jgi:hypothetical protein
MYQVGTAKKDITPSTRGIGMMGYGMWFNRAKEVETQLYARAFVFQHDATQKKIHHHSY